MVMRAFGKTVLRTMKRNATRLLAVTAIITLGICFVCGLGVLGPKIRSTFDAQLRAHDVVDVIVKAKSESGLSDTLIDELATLDCVENTQPLTMLEIEDEETAERFYFMPVADMPFNRLQLLEGDFPTEAGQCIVERASDTVHSRSIGDVRTLSVDTPIGTQTFEFTVTGIVANPLFFTRNGDSSLQNEKPLSSIAYTTLESFRDISPIAAMLANNLPVTDLYVRVTDAQKQSVFSDGYAATVSKAVERMQAVSDEPAYLTLEENKSTAFLDAITEKIDIITMLFPIFFILVTALVVLTTMTRLVEEERAAIGCCRTLGYSEARIAFKYLLYALLCCCVGIIVGNAIGAYLLPSVICPAFNIVFFLPPLTGAPNLSLGLISSAAMLVAVLSVTGYAVHHSLNEKPAMLLKPKAPKPGKKIFLEHIPLLWKHMAFKYKSMFRNVFRYVGRLLMVVVSVAGSTALMLAGFGLHNVANIGSMVISGIVVEGIGDSIRPIAAVIIVFAALLCILVVYNLTNMDISERRREVATLKVLGYNDLEVCGYVYRETLLMAFFGILLGLPLGAGILRFVFYLLDFGSMLDVQWYSYLLSAAIELIAIVCVDLLLYPKIRREDMNTSLKAVE